MYPRENLFSLGLQNYFFSLHVITDILQQYSKYKYPLPWRSADDMKSVRKIKTCPKFAHWASENVTRFHSTFPWYTRARASVFFKVQLWMATSTAWWQIYFWCWVSIPYCIHQFCPAVPENMLPLFGQGRYNRERQPTNKPKIVNTAGPSRPPGQQAPGKLVQCMLPRVLLLYYIRDCSIVCNFT